MLIMGDEAVLRCVQIVAHKLGASAQEFLLHRDVEALALIKACRKIHASIIVEVGSNTGGSLALWMLSRPGATVVSIDVVECPYIGRLMELARNVGSTLYQIVGDSGAIQTVNVLLDYLGGRLIDLLYLDGDHTYSGVSRDLSLYGQLVREGGVMGLHDINNRRLWSPNGEHESVGLLWDQIRLSDRASEVNYSPSDVLQRISRRGLGFIQV